MKQLVSKPKWIRSKPYDAAGFNRIEAILKKHRINTVCHSARCPNLGECFAKNRMTFMILGDVCTRQCRFCAVKKGVPGVNDPSEAQRVLGAAILLKLSHAVITSVTRDDLPDGGADVFTDIVVRLKQKNIYTEILTPDFFGVAHDNIVKTKPDIWAHNVETVPRLYKDVRSATGYDYSIALLRNIKLKTNDITTKSGIMLGLGEAKEEVLEVFKDLRSAHVDIVTVGQYLRPNVESVPVTRYVHPDEFRDYEREAIKMGFKQAVCGPLVRSSYTP